MNLDIVSILKGLIPVLEPIGEQGINQLFSLIDAEVAKMGNSDFKVLFSCISPGLKQFALLEMQKLK